MLYEQQRIRKFRFIIIAIGIAMALLFLILTLIPKLSRQALIIESSGTYNYYEHSDTSSFTLYLTFDDEVYDGKITVAFYDSSGSFLDKKPNQFRRLTVLPTRYTFIQ